MNPNSRTFKTAQLTVLSLSLLNCSSQAVQTVQTVQTVQPEPVAPKSADEHNLSLQDPGKYQSPINIHTLKSHKMKKNQQYEVHFRGEINAVENKGHTVQVDFARGSEVVFEGVHYAFRQFHFHTPAEHHIDGIVYPMEMHIVCSTADKEPSYVVITLLFKMGPENRFLSEFLNSVPKQPHSSKTLEFNQVKLTHFLSLEDKGKLAHHYHYQGSLTTPPYTERVNWVIYQHIFDASPEQIGLIQQLEGYNARPLQPINNRIVEQD